MKKKLLNRLMVGAGLLATSAMALADDPFTAAVADVTGKVTTYGGALVGVAAAGVAFMVGIKYVKKIRGAA